jgi:putative FmdB family regulatory protein
MPTYEYRCKSCGDQLEVVQAFTDDALTDCPTCGAEGQLRKVFGNIGITFKGSGFYKTDSRSTSTAKKKDGDGGDSGSSTDAKPAETKAGDTPAESKPAEKKPTDSSTKPSTSKTSAA